MVKARTTVGRKGRTVIPIAARQAAGIEEGDELVVLTDAPGRLVLMTRDAIQGEVWRAAADMRSEADAITDVRAMRREDTRITDAAAERPRCEVRSQVVGSTRSGWSCSAISASTSRLDRSPNRPRRVRPSRMDSE